MGSAENGGGQHPAPEGRKIGTPPPRMFLTPSLIRKAEYQTCEEKKLQANVHLTNKFVFIVVEGKRGSYYPALKKLGLRPGETNHPSFQLPEHVENKFSASQSVEIFFLY